MKIGLDLSVIQTPHRMRGIGATAINFINNLPDDLKKQHTFVIFLYEKGQADALEILDLKGLNYEVKNLEEVVPIRLNVPGRLKIINGLFNNLRRILDIYRGDQRIKELGDIEAFLQFEQMAPLPKSRRVKTAQILYDIIPYVMESDYLWAYKTARKHGDSRKSAIRKQAHRKLYKLKTKAAAKRADLLIAISHHTKNDFVKYIGINPSRIKVVHLGITPNSINKDLSPEFKHFIENSWGYFPKPIDLKDKPFLLYVGGADPRRKLNHLVAAFNNLKAQGNDIRLVFAGDTMKGPHAIPILETQKYMAASSYLDDMIFLGFVGEDQKSWLYQNTIAFVYPSIYEGFGLPILEAMRYGAPVITYSNSSVTEIIGDAAIKANNHKDIKLSIEALLQKPALREQKAAAGIQHAKNFSWETTVRSILSEYK